MAVEQHIPANLPASTIGTVKRRTPRPEDKIVLVKDPEGNVHEMTRSNMRDKVRLDGWTVVTDNQRPQANEPAPTAEAALVEEEEVETEEAIGANREPTELDHLRADYIAKAGKQPDMRWGKKKLQEKIALLDD